MTKPTHPGAEKAARHEAKGDKLMVAGKAAKALAEYRKALEQDSDRAGIFDKLIAARDRVGGDWNQEDFAESVSWAMQKQAQENPAIRQVHAKLSPEWHKAMEIVLRLVQSEREVPGELIEELVGMGEVATRALICVILDFKRAAEAPAQDEGAPSKDEGAGT